MAGVNSRNVSIAVIRKPLATLLAENKVHRSGVIIIAVDALGKQGIKVGDWDWINFPDPSTGTAFSQLDWVLTPEQSGSSSYTPFTVVNDNTKNGSAHYSIVGNDAVITDTRFIGVSEVLVRSTKTGSDIRKGDMILDAVLGKLTLTNYYGMDNTEHLAIEVPSVIRAADSVTALIPRMEAVELYTAPVKAEGAIWIWRKPFNQIPTGWREVVELQGKTIIGNKDSDPLFTPVWSKTGGSASHKISSVNFLPKLQFFTVVDDSISSSSFPEAIGRAITSLRSLIRSYSKSGTGKESYDLAGAAADNTPPNISPTNALGKDDPDEIDHLNPYRIVYFIELIPV